MSVNRLFVKQDWETLNERIPGLINIARIAIVLSLLVFHLFSFSTGGETAKSMFPTVEFYSWITVYGLLILLTVFKPDWQLQTLELPNASAVVDITMIMVLTYITGGIESGFGILVLPFIATSCLLSHGRYPMLYAGYALLLILLNMFFAGQVQFQPLEWDGRIFCVFCTFGRRVFPRGRINRFFRHLSASRHRVGHQTPARLPPRERLEPRGAQPRTRGRDCD